MDWCEIFAASGTLADLYVYYEREGAFSSRSALWLMHSAMFLEKVQCPALFGMDGLLKELIKAKNGDGDDISTSSTLHEVIRCATHAMLNQLASLLTRPSL